jgi:hypothetical protein
MQSISVDEAEHFTGQSTCQRRYAPMVFGIIPECRSASFRNWRSASPESQSGAQFRGGFSGRQVEAGFYLLGAAKNGRHFRRD